MKDDNPDFDQSQVERRLAMIAQLLGLSAKSFSDAACAAGKRSGALTAVEEASALLQAFERITDASTRARCLAYVEALAEQDAAKVEQER